MNENLRQIVDNLKDSSAFQPKVGIVLGSGLGGFTEKVNIEKRISYADIEGFPKSTVEGHGGEYIFGYLGDVPVMLMNGRVHYYEGYPMNQVVLPVRVMALMGCDTIILTNASGGINKSFAAGTIMCIDDHISNFVPSPLIGPNDDSLGTRFPDMNEIYNRDLIKLLDETAEEMGIEIKHGVYLQTTGPAYESPAEVRMFRTVGADAVGMSTACEAMVLNHMGIKLLGISCVTNMAMDDFSGTLTHEEVQEIAALTGGKIGNLIEGVIKKL